MNKTNNINKNNIQLARVARLPTYSKAWAVGPAKKGLAGQPRNSKRAILGGWEEAELGIKTPMI